MLKKDEVSKEFEAISAMVKAADAEGLLVEVIWSYGNEMMQEIEVPQAVENALHENGIITPP